MTHDHSALLARLDTLKGADVASVFAELIRTGLQELIEAEATEALVPAATNASRAAPPTATGTGPRRSRPPAGRRGQDPETPRSGSFFPSLLEHRRRIDKALHAVIMEAYVHSDVEVAFRTD